MTKTEEFQDLRPLLFSIAYRILGSVTEAEDAVQESWLRYDAAATPPVSARAYLSAVVTRVSTDVASRARSSGTGTAASSAPWRWISSAGRSRAFAR